MVPAVLTYELVMTAAKAIARERIGPFPWGMLNDDTQVMCFNEARVALLAAGFEGADDGE